MTKEQLITKLVEVVLKQEKEIYNLRKQIDQIKQYIEVYEDYIKGE